MTQDEPRIVLGIGCGTGEIARPLAAFVDRVDAVDQSAAMIRIGRCRDGGDRPNIMWVYQNDEGFSCETRYSLIVAGASLHWMDWYDVLPRMAGSLSPRSYLAIVGGHEIAAVRGSRRRVLPWPGHRVGVQPNHWFDTLGGRAGHRGVEPCVDTLALGQEALRGPAGWPSRRPSPCA